MFALPRYACLGPRRNARSGKRFPASSAFGRRAGSDRPGITSMALLPGVSPRSCWHAGGGPNRRKGNADRSAFYRMIDGAGAKSLAATRVGSPVEPVSKPPRVMPARNAISIVTMIAPERGGAPLIARSCFSKSSWSCWSIGRHTFSRVAFGQSVAGVSVPLPRVEVSPRFASQQFVCDAQVSVGDALAVSIANGDREAAGVAARL
jgi:hypothetical protein